MRKKYFNYSKVYFSFLLIFAAGTLFSQQSLSDKFTAYSKTAIQEKLFLHTDREFYVAGEIMWFKVYYADGSTHKPMELSKVAYVEVISEKNEAVLQGKISLLPGESKGSFYLPATLNTGNYIIRAYTSWMKNFGAENFFEKKVVIVNTLKSPEVAAARDAAAGGTVRFFPEGGNLVRGIETKLGFIADNNKGSIHQFRGFIVNQDNDTITSFTPLKFGLGSFLFTPAPGNNYKAIIVLPDGSSFNQPLPEIFDNGYVIKVADKNNGQLEVTVQRKRMTGESSAEQVSLAVHTRQALALVERATINDNGSALFLLDKNKLGKGVTHLTLFNSNDKPLCERLVFVKPGTAVSLQVKSDQPAYANRAPVNLSLTAQYNGSTVPLNLSASVFRLDSLQQADQSNIVDYMWLTSDMAGAVESPGYYFSNDPDVSAATDNLMLTHGWRRFTWSNILAGGKSFIKYAPEIYGQVITGKLRDSRTDNPVANGDAYLSVPGEPFGFYASKSDKDGLLFFEVKDYYGNKQVIAQAGIETDSFWRVDIIKPFAESAPVTKIASYKLTEAIQNQLLQKSIGMQVQNIYTGDSIRNFTEPVIYDTLPFYGFPETQYKLDNYKRFTTMEEVLREYVSEIGVTVRNGKPGLRIFNPDAHDFYDSYALVLLDGVALRDINKIFAYDPLKVKKLDVIRSRYVLGHSSFNGIASFSTYDGMFDAFDLDPKLVSVDYAGLQLQREFYSPAYTTKQLAESRLPDFRNTLFWSPDIHTDKDGKASLQFYTSDRKGTYVVVLQGMSDKGDMVYSTATLEVK